MMWNVVKGAAVFVFLLYFSIQDIKEKKLSVGLLVLSGCLLLTASFLFEDREIEQRISSLLPGMTAFLLAFLTKEQIGYGDAACLVVLGSVLSADILLYAVMGGLILLSIISVVLLAGKRADRKTTLPFLPFLSAGMLVQAVLMTMR